MEDGGGEGGAFDDCWRAIVSSPKAPALPSFVSGEGSASKSMPLVSDEARAPNGDYSCLPLVNNSIVSSEAIRGGGGGRGGCGSIAERRAATCGFKGSGRINTARFRSNSTTTTAPLSSPTAGRSPYLITIPSGISPTALLDSPITPLPPPNPQPLMNFEYPIDFSQAVAKNGATDASINIKVTNHMILNASDKMHQRGEPIHGEDVGVHHLQGGDKSRTYPFAGVVRTSEDGYNWRKYGQKHVKGSEYPRSYYKCTHPNCKVKKKLESSPDGWIIEIIYDGVHNHRQPQPNRRLTLGSSFSYNDMLEAKRSYAEDGAVWRNFSDVTLGSEWKDGGLETSASILTAISDPLSNIKVKYCRDVFASVGTPELSSTLASHDVKEDGTSLRDDVDAAQSKSKRRKKGISSIKTNLASRVVREPRVVVEIESEVDIIDDGCRWRKYGQKVVKGNVNPRSYYKCINVGCSVRKHVERAFYNFRYVITTYEGKHNHEVPAAKNGGFLNLGSRGILSPAASTTRPTLAFPGNANAVKPEAEVQDQVHHFEGIPNLGNEYVQSNLLRNLESGVKFEASSPVYQLDLPSLQFSMPCVSFVPDFLMSPLPLNISRSTSLAAGDFNYNYEKPICSSFEWHRLRKNDMRLIEPKQEPRDDNIYDTQLQPVADYTNTSKSSPSSSASSSVYYRAKRSLPS